MEDGLEWIRNQELDQYYTVSTSKMGYKVFRCIRNLGLQKKATRYVTNRSKKDTDCKSKLLIKRCLKCKCGKVTPDNVCEDMAHFYILSLIHI